MANRTTTHDYDFYRLARPAQIAEAHTAKAVDVMAGTWTLINFRGAALTDSKGRLVIVRASEQELREDGIMCSNPIVWR